MHCSICDSPMAEVFDALVLREHRVSYHHCSGCGFLRTESPYWLQQAYSDCIAASDTGLVARNIRVARLLSCLLGFVFGERGAGKWLDFAGGYGLLVRLMRDNGFDFYWSDKYAPNLFARGFEHRPATQYTGVTAIEIIEHVEDPVAMLNRCIALSGTRTVIFTTELYPFGPPPRPQAWWYYALNTGQHISFFQRATLRTLAQRLSLNLYSTAGLHVSER
jgi:hypothetical protein